ncbi:MAG: TatD family hydrolase [Candidatus Poseidonia sp.]|uniref:TatD family hydrolase n=1 Tax=Poseidonia sp. TaxID=2666344 RepID=UPI0030C4E684|nr:TatD family hydrolase [Poseidonia sp.]
MTYDGPILDNHFHLNRNGRFLDAATDFQRAGGTDLVLVHCPDFAKPPETLAGHRAAYQDTIDMAAKVRGEVGLGVRVVLGPHPAAFAHQFERWVAEDVVSGEEKAINNYRHSIDAALEFIDEGEAHAVGEVGRPHWPVEERILELSNQLLDETMHLAAQQGLPLQLHVEGESEATYPDLAQRAKKQGMDLVKLVRHYAPANVDASSTHGLTPSVLIGKGALEELMSTYEASSHGFFLETDYMDDLRRPGAVLGPKTVPKRTQQLIAAGLPEDILWNTHQELARRVYGA